MVKFLVIGRNAENDQGALDKIQEILAKHGPFDCILFFGDSNPFSLWHSKFLFNF